LEAIGTFKGPLSRNPGEIELAHLPITNRKDAAGQQAVITDGQPSGGEKGGLVTGTARPSGQSASRKQLA
jgi:hypothetical protein